MKFSGHETFPVGEGWLHKGLTSYYTTSGYSGEEELSSGVPRANLTS
jgi:hypothetical protein